MRRSRGLAGRLAMGALVVGLAAGCGDARETVTGTPPPTAEPAAELEDGRHFGYIMSVDLDTSSIVFEQAAFLSGEEANEAAREDGFIEEGDTVPNDYYIRGLDTGEQTLTLTADVRIVVVNWDDCCETTEGELEGFAAGFEEDAGDLGNYRGSASPYWVTLEGGDVVHIEEQYLP